MLDTAAPFDSPSKPKRIRTMTEKARLLKDEEVKETRLPSRVGRVVKVKQEKNSDDR